METWKFGIFSLFRQTIKFSPLIMRHFFQFEIKMRMTNMIRIKFKKIKMSSFLPGMLVKCRHGPWQTKLFLFIAVGFSNSEKEDEEGWQRGRILQWGSLALSRYCWSTGFELAGFFQALFLLRWNGEDWTRELPVKDKEEAAVLLSSQCP